MKLVAVLAGNQREFFHFIDERLNHVEKLDINYTQASCTDGHTTKWFYVSGQDQLRGLRHFEIIRYGTWINRKDNDRISELEQVARMAGDIK